MGHSILLKLETTTSQFRDVGYLALAIVSVLLATTARGSPQAASPQTPTQAAPSEAQGDESSRRQAIATKMYRAVSLYDEGHFALAASTFDEADQLAGGVIFLNPEIHARRALSFDSVGRKDDALREAQIAFDFLRDGPTVSREVRNRFFATNTLVDLDLVFSMSVNLFKKFNDSRLPAATTALLGLTPTDGAGFSNRASILEELGRYPEAIEASNRALELMPSHPGVLNNHCYILARADFAAKGLPFCETAIKLAPNISALRSSYSTAFAKLGECAKAQEQKSIALRLDPRSVEALKPLECIPKS